MENKTITIEQSDLAFEFIELLFSEDIHGFWNIISKVDQARLYGMYRADVDLEDGQDISFLEYIRDVIKPDIEEIYEEVREGSGIATHERFTDEGETLVYLLPNVNEPTVYTETTQEVVFPVSMTVDANLFNGQVNYEWKIRLYADQEYKVLS